MILESYCDIRRCFDDSETIGLAIAIRTNITLQKASGTTITPNPNIKFTKVKPRTKIKLCVCDFQNWN
jgi:hypothetical protein